MYGGAGHIVQRIEQNCHNHENICTNILGSDVTCYFNLWILKIVSSPGFPAVNSASLFPQFRLLGRHSFVLIFDTTNKSKYISLSVIQYDVIGKKW